jgi:hypothetical protein
MKQVEQAEKTLSGLFKDLPPLPAAGKENIVKVMPWIALIFGILQVLAGYVVWRLADRADRIADLVNTYSSYYTVPGVHISAFDRTVIYLGAVVLLVSGVIGIMAYKPLVARLKSGWDLMLLAALVNLVYAVIAIFINDRGFDSFIMSLIGSAVGFYLLFQIKSAYSKKTETAK